MNIPIITAEVVAGAGNGGLLGRGIFLLHQVPEKAPGRAGWTPGAPRAAQIKFHVSLLPKSPPPESRRGNQTFKFENEPVRIFLINTALLMSQQKPIGFGVAPNDLTKRGCVSLRGEKIHETNISTFIFQHGSYPIAEI